MTRDDQTRVGKEKFYSVSVLAKATNYSKSAVTNSIRRGIIVPDVTVISTSGRPYHGFTTESIDRIKVTGIHKHFVRGPAAERK